MKDLSRIFLSIGCVSKLTTTVNITETGIANIITSIEYQGITLINMSTPNMNLQIPKPVAVFLNTNTSKNKLVKVIPSVLAEINKSQTLICYNELVNESDKKCVENLLKNLLSSAI